MTALNKNIMRRKNGSEPSILVRLFLTSDEKIAIQRLVESQNRTTANVCTMLVRERLQQYQAERKRR